MKVDEPVVTTHPSGLRVAVRPMPDNPVASVHLWFDTGAVDEPPPIAGAAHFLEHMLFKGTARRAVGEAAAAIEAAGGDLNAWTSWDETCFHATLEASEVDLALDVVFDMTSASVLDRDELEREKQVVLEEIRGYEDEPDSVAADRVQSLLFGEHPYGRPVIGFPSTVSALDRDAVASFWRANYHPGRAVLAIAGGVDPAAIARKVDGLVARWPTGSARAAIPRVAPVTNGRIERMDREFGSVVVQMAWPGPPIGDPDLAALDVLMQALGGGASAALTVKLDLEQGYASHVWADAMSWVGGGLLALGFLCGETEDAIATAVTELARAGRDGLPGSAVARARDSLLADLLFATETAEGVASDLAWSVARTGNPRADLEYAGMLAAVTPAKVREVAARYLDLDQMRLVVIDKDLEPKRLSSVVAKARKAAAPAKAARKLDQVVRSRVAGVDLAVLPEAGEIAAIQVLGVGGQLLESERTAGASEAWSRLVLRGAGPFDSTALAERSDAMALSLDASAGRSVAAVQASFPASETEPTLALIGELLADPHLAEPDWDNVREELLDDQAALEDRPGTVASELLWRSLWPDHPWRLPQLGTAGSIGRIRPKALAKLHAAQMAADNLTIAVVGGVDPDRVARVLEPYLQDLPPKAEIPDRPVSAPPPTPDKPVQKRAGNEQATVLCGVRGIPISHEARTALNVATHLLDSQSGRLFLRLREERGLAYGVWARAESGLDGGVLSAGLQTDPERVDEAVSALVAELRLLTERGPERAELDRVTRMIAGLAAMRHQRVSARASDLGWSLRFGLPYGLAALKERLAAVTPDGVRRSLERLGFGAPTVVVVRPRTRKGKG